MWKCTVQRTVMITEPYWHMTVLRPWTSSVILLYGLKNNVDKTKVLSTDGSLAIIHLNADQIEQVQQFKYLVVTKVQEKKVATTAEVVPVEALQHLVCLFWTLILPVLLYGSETWMLLKSSLNESLTNNSVALNFKPLQIRRFTF